MSWSFPVARLFGTQIRIHITFLLLLVWVGVAAYGEYGWPGVVFGIAFMLALFLCVILHEFGHALTARAFGIATPDITLLPIGGLARLERMPRKPAHELLVALAGPAVNVVIATVLFLFLQVGSPIQEVSLEPRSITGFFVSLMAINVWLAIFNLIPAFPMDGGRVLRALLATRLSYVRATKVAATAGQAMAFLGVYLGFVLPAPILVLVSLFIFIMAGAEASAVRLQEATKDIPVSEAMMTSFETVTGQDSIGDAVDLLLDGSQTDFPVVDIAGRLVGLVRRDDLIGVLREHGDQVSVTCAMSDCDVTLKAEMPLSEALAKIQSSGFRTIPVTGRGDRLIGLLSLENIGELVMVRSALEDRTEKRLEGAQPTNRGDGVLGNFPVRW